MSVRDEIKTIEVNSSHNIEHIAISPTDPIMLCINEGNKSFIP